MLKLNSHVSIRVRHREIVGKLIGVDYYSLENFEGRKFTWPSYTLVSPYRGRFARYWLVRWGRTEWILWLQDKRKKPPRNARLLLSKSGVAKICFEGDAGVSTPYAALMQYKTGEHYYSAERFSGSKVLFFEGMKIAKPEPVVLSK